MSAKVAILEDLAVLAAKVERLRTEIEAALVDRPGDPDPEDPPDPPDPEEPEIDVTRGRLSPLGAAYKPASWEPRRWSAAVELPATFPLPGEGPATYVAEVQLRSGDHVLIERGVPRGRNAEGRPTFEFLAPPAPGDLVAVRSSQGFELHYDIPADLGPSASMQGRRWDPEAAPPPPQDGGLLHEHLRTGAGGTMLKESTHEDGTPSGRGAVLLLTKEATGRVASVSTGGTPWRDATDYERLPNGGRLHFRNPGERNPMGSYVGQQMRLVLTDGSEWHGEPIANGTRMEPYRFARMAEPEPGPEPGPVPVPAALGHVLFSEARPPDRFGMRNCQVAASVSRIPAHGAAEIAVLHPWYDLPGNGATLDARLADFMRRPLSWRQGFCVSWVQSANAKGCTWAGVDWEGPFLMRDALSILEAMAAETRRLGMRVIHWPKLNWQHQVGAGQFGNTGQAWAWARQWMDAVGFWDPSGTRTSYTAGIAAGRAAGFPGPIVGLAYFGDAKGAPLAEDLKIIGEPWGGIFNPGHQASAEVLAAARRTWG